MIQSFADAFFADVLEDIDAHYKNRPLVREGFALVCTKFEADVVLLMGDFDDWSVGVEMKRCGDWWYSVVPTSMEQRTSYKLKVGADWFLDPQNPHISFGPQAPNNSIVPDCCGCIFEIAHFYSPELDNERSLYVYLPPGYSAQESYPIVYFQDGFNIFENPQAPFGDWGLDSTLDGLLKKGLIPPLIAVGIDTPNRMDEYSWSSFSYEEVIAPKLALYGQFLRETLHSEMCLRFSLCGEVAIAGGSLGGSSALWLAWHHSDFISKVACFSGSFWMDSPTMWECIEANESPPLKKVYLDSGDCDGEGSRSYQADNLCYVDRTHTALVEQGFSSASPVHKVELDHPIETLEFHDWSEDMDIPTQSLCFLVGKGHMHNEEAWKARLSVALRFLFSNDHNAVVEESLMGY